MMNQIEELPDELAEVLNSLEFDDEAGIVIESVKFIDQFTELIFSIRFFDEIPRQLWMVSIEDTVAEHITQEWTQDINIFIQHALLLEYSENHSELYFKGIAKDANELFIDIFQSIRNLSEDISDISRYILSYERVKILSSQGYGLFASGPLTILNVYEKCMIKQGIKPIFIGDFETSHQKDSLRMLKIGKSYCIGSSIRFERKINIIAMQ